MSRSKPNAVHVLLFFHTLFFASAWLLPVPESLTKSIFVAGIGLLVWQVVLLLVSRSPGEDFRIEWNIRKPHYIQASLQATLYFYWGLYWADVWQYVPAIMVQIIFAYIFEMLLAWSRRRVWLLGFGQVPIVLSLNLFIWFLPQFYVFQFVLVACAYLGKEFVTWNYDGRKRHIFNPSAFPLAIVSAGLLLTGTWDATRAIDIVESFPLAPNFLEVVFLLTLVVQFLFGTTAVTLGAATALCLTFYAGEAIAGARLFEVPIGHSVFVGISLLVTDPSTSPRSNLGKFVFGLLYGSGLFVACIVFHIFQQPAVFDKILLVPFLNLLVPLVDRAGAGLFGRFPAVELPSAKRYGRYGWIAVYAALFLAILPAHKTIYWFFESPLPNAVGFTSQNVDQLRFNSRVSQLEFPDVYLPFGFSAEYSEYPNVKKVLGLDRTEAERILLEYLEPEGVRLSANGAGPEREGG